MIKYLWLKTLEKMVFCRWRRVKPRLPPGEKWADSLEYHRVVLAGHLLFLFGGKSRDPDAVYILNTTTKVWRKIVQNGATSAATVGHSATLVGDRVFLIGGSDARVYPGEHIHVYDLVLQQWFTKETFGDDPGYLNCHSAELLEHRRDVFVFKGGGLNSTSNVLYSLDTLTFRWIRVQPKGKPPRARSTQASCVQNRKMYIFGGGSFSAVYNDLFIFTYDINGPRWECPRIKGDSPKGRFGASLTSIDGKLLMFGGQVVISPSCELFWFDPRLCEWTLETPENEHKNALSSTLNRSAPPPRSYHATVLSPQKRLMVLGGSRNPGRAYYELSFK